MVLVTPRAHALLLAGLAFLAGCRGGGGGQERPAAGTDVLARWVELGPDGAVVARALTRAPACPTLTVDGIPAAMRVRAAPAAPAFPVLTCELALPRGASRAALEGRALPLPAATLQKLVILGDTGCRIKSSTFVQDCGDGAAWPLARVAQAAAAQHPDLVVHVGDYLYREAACPPGVPGCANSPWGDTWAAWDADFFTPAAPLLDAAPWVVVRGNHELCRRAGQGWFRFLDPRALPADCADLTEPYTVPTALADLLVTDTAAANDEQAPPADVAAYRAQLEKLLSAARPQSILVTHKPVWAVATPDDGGPELEMINATLQAALAGLSTAPVALLLSGHVHAFEALGFASGRPPQFVVGESGTLLIRPLGKTAQGAELDGLPVTTGVTALEFGFATLERQDGAFQLVERRVDGAPATTCTISGTTLTCTR